MFRIRQLQSGISEVQRQLEGKDLGVTWSWKMEEAKLRWARGERDTAMYLLKSLARHLEKVHCNGKLEEERHMSNANDFSLSYI